MLMPSIFNNRLFDEMMDFPFGRDFFGDSGRMLNDYRTGVMKTDVKEADGVYEVDMELPGYKKEDVSARLDKGYLTVQFIPQCSKNLLYLLLRKSIYGRIGTISKQSYHFDNLVDPGFCHTAEAVWP